jgi:hypothetical protein
LKTDCPQSEGDENWRVESEVEETMRTLDFREKEGKNG